MNIPFVTHSKPSTAQRVAKGLGVFSIALGASEIAAYKPICDFFGLTREDLLRGYGLREIATGAGILLSPGRGGKLSPWLWGRVVGDILDMAAFSGTLVPYNWRRKRGLTAEGVLFAITLLDLWCAVQLQREGK